MEQRGGEQRARLHWDSNYEGWAGWRIEVKQRLACMIGSFTLNSIRQYASRH